MAERYSIINKEEPRGESVADEGIPCTARTCVTRLNRYEELKNDYDTLKLQDDDRKLYCDELHEEIKFLLRIIDFFANNPMTKYSSREELLKEMKTFAKMGLI